MAHTSACATAIKRSVPDLADDDVEEILSAMYRRAQGMPNRRGDMLRWMEIAREKSAAEIKKAKIKAREARINAQLRIANDTALDARVSVGRGDKAGVQALSDAIVESERAGAGRAFSTANRQKAAIDEFRGAFLADIQLVEGGLPLLRHLDRDPEAERAIAREMSRLSGGQGIAPATDARIKGIAEAMVRHRERLRLEMNRAGAWIERLPGYVGRTSHDIRRMKTAGFERWVGDITPKLDLPRIFAERDIDPTDAAAVRAFLRDVYGNLLTGIHHVRNAGATDPMTGFKGPGNLARALSEDRVLHFRDADGWLDYNRLYGSGNLLATFMGQIEHGAEALAMMRQWGTNPEAAFQGAARRLATRLRDRGAFGQAKAIEDAMKAGGKLAREWAVVSGAADIPAHLSAAQIGAGIRALEGMMKLGGVTLSSLSDMPVAAATLSHEGINYWTVMGRNVRALFEGVPQGIRAEVAANLNAGFNGVLGGIYHRMGYGDATQGWIARAADTFFKLNLQTWWMDGLERGVSFMLADHVGTSLTRPWTTMNAALRAGLERYGVTEADWLAAQGVELLRDRGSTYFHPGLLRDIGNVPAAERFGAWFADMQAAAMTRPTAYTRALMTMGQPPGTVLGEAMRLMMQFKQFPATVISRHLGREAYRGGERANIGNIAQFVAMTTLFGYVAMTLKEIAKGRNPREIDSAEDAIKTVTAAFVQGGGAGIFADFLFGEYNRMGTSFLATVAGPAAGTAEGFARLFARARDEAVASTGEGANLRGLGAEALRFATTNAPFLNLFYAKAAIDHLIIHELQEALSPGYLRRFERRVARENNQSFWLRPGGGLGEGPIADLLRP